VIFVNLIKDVKDLYKENYKPWKKEDYRRWNNLPCSWIGVLPKAIYMLKTILIKIPMKFITEIEKSTLK
jgi:hypothetical protein